MPARKYIFETGQKVGSWLVLEYKKHTSEQQSGYWCRCDCGKEKIVPSAQLALGNPICITCSNKKRATHGAARRVNGRTHTPEYGSWTAMKQRCLNPHNPAYMGYGGRGIIVCERWLGRTGFQNFIRDMGLKPSPEHSIDRKDVNGSYCPENCRWATKSEQQQNRRPFKIGRIESFTDEELAEEFYQRTPEYGIGIAC